MTSSNGKFSAILAICAGNSPVPGEFPAQRPVTLSFDVFFDLRLNKRLRKHLWGWWFETSSRPLWRHCDANGFDIISCVLNLLTFLTWKCLSEMRKSEKRSWAPIQGQYLVPICDRWSSDNSLVWPRIKINLHDDVIKWKHFPRYWPFVRGIHGSPVISRTKASDAELWCFLWSASE